jgi:hypothetical protein
MRRFISAAAIVMTAAISYDGVSLTPIAAQDRVAGILADTRKALGGDKATNLKTLTAEGPFRRTMGGRDMEGTVVVTIARPDKMHRLEEMAMGGMVGGPVIERTMALNGTTSWEDSQNRGGMGGGMRIVMQTGPGPGGGQMTPEQINEARTRRMRVQFQRLTAALFADAAGLEWVDAGVAESPEGKADILEAKEETGRTLRLFIDQNTKLPLMVQYQDPKPMVMINNGPGRGPGGPGGPGAPPVPPPPPGGAAHAGGPPQPPAAPMSPEEMQKRMEEVRRNPPPLGTYAMHLSDFKKVDGVMLPHKIETSLDGEPNEEWTIEKFKVNPSIKTDLFEKK